jgi:hypothetical protein
VAVQLAADSRLRLDAIRDLARGAGKAYTGGRPVRGDADAGRRAYVDARLQGATRKFAFAAAEAASGLKRSRIFELKKKQGWDDEVSRNRVR